jgi:hypothetical protein
MPNDFEVKSRVIAVIPRLKRFSKPLASGFPRIPTDYGKDFWF